MDSIGNVIWRVFLTLIFLISSLFFIVSLVLFSDGEWLTGIALLGLAPTSFVMLHAGLRWIFTGQHPKPRDYLGNRIVVSSIQILWAVVRAPFSYFYNLIVLLGILFSGFIQILVFKASSIKGKRTGWGWAAIFAVGFGLMSTLWIAMGHFGLRDKSWDEWEEDLSAVYYSLSRLRDTSWDSRLRDTSWDEWEETTRLENLTLPRKIDNITSLEKISMSDTDKSITYRLSVDHPSIRDTDMRSVILQGCADLKDLFSIFSLIRFEYVDRSEFVLVEVLSSDDCNF